MDSSLVLTAIEHADTEFVAALAADERVTAFIGDGSTWSYELAAQRVSEAIDSPEISWFIARKAGVPVGLFTATERADATEIGYWIDPQFWGQGMATAVIGAGIAQLETGGCCALIARVEAANIASLKVLVRYGFLSQAKGADGLITLTRVSAEG